MRGRTIHTAPERPRRQRAFNHLGEALLFASLAGAVAFVITSRHYLAQLREASTFSVPAQRELAPLLSKYGPRGYSRRAEEQIIRDFFQDRRGGTFLDVGANHYRDENNTFFLETVLEWSGLAVDALPEFGPDYVKHRPRTRFVPAFVSDEDDGTVTFFVPGNNKLVASVDRDFTVQMQSPGEAQQIHTTTLDTLLEQAGIDRIDFVSMDIELAEPKALAGFDIDKYRPTLLCIEAHPQVRQQILDYFAVHQYVVVGKYLRMDAENLYFTPLHKGRGSM